MGRKKEEGGKSVWGEKQERRRKKEERKKESEEMFVMIKRGGTTKAKRMKGALRANVIKAGVMEEGEAQRCLETSREDDQHHVQQMSAAQRLGYYLWSHQMHCLQRLLPGAAA